MASAGVPVKNAFELKNARRVLVEGNIFEHVWASGQDGTAIVLKSTNQEGRCTWCVTEFVTFRNNIVRAAAHGLLINAAEAGARGLPLPQRANHIRVQNVVFRDIGGREWGGGKLFRVLGGVSDVEITHVTSTGNGTGILDPRDPADRNPNLVFKYNIVERRCTGSALAATKGSPLSREISRPTSTTRTCSSIRPVDRSGDQRRRAEVALPAGHDHRSGLDGRGISERLGEADNDKSLPPGRR